jgi:TonB family protein
MPLEWKHWLGQTINEKFELGEYLGGSEDSATFLTTVGPQKAVIKLVALDAQNDAEKLDAKRVDRQLSLLAKARNLSHPHIIRVFEAGQCVIDEKPLLYVVMEYAEENLSMILPTRALTPTETREMLDPVLEALTYIHGQGFVHGHLKPSNIMALHDTLKISCDGITPIGQRDDHPSKQSSYLPAETVSGGRSPSADIWALGVTLVEVLTQQAPQIRSDAEKKSVVSKLPSPFRDIASECLWTDPKQRCTVEDIQEQLHSPVSASIPSAGAPATPRRRRSLVGPIAIGVLLAAILGGVFIFEHRSPSSAQTDQTTQTSAAPASNPQTEAKVSPNSASSGPPVGSVGPRKAMRRVLPDVSNNALRTIHGTVKVKVKVYVDQDGNVERARLESRGPSRYFANKSMDAAKQWRFDPAGSDNKNVPGEWDLEFRFSSTSRQVRERPVLR